MAVDGINGPKTVGRLTTVFQKESAETQRDKDPQQQTYEDPRKKKEFTKWDFTKEEFEIVLKEFEELPFFKGKSFKLKLEQEFPHTIIYICDQSDSVIKRLTVPEFIQAVKYEKERQNDKTEQTGHLINKKA